MAECAMIMPAGKPGAAEACSTAVIVAGGVDSGVLNVMLVSVTGDVAVGIRVDVIAGRVAVINVTVFVTVGWRVGSAV
jgi:hypothetical protein